MPREHYPSPVLASPTFWDLSDHDRHRLVTTYFGEITVDDLAAHLEHLEEGGVIGFDQFTDLTEAHFSSNTGALLWLAELFRTKTRAGSLGKMAYLAGDDLTFGLARMLSAYADPDSKIKVFRQRVPAFEWLGWND